MKRYHSTSILAAIMLLTACNGPTETSPEALPRDAEEGPIDESTPSVSILRPGIERPEPAATQAALEPLSATIGFADGGTELDAEAVSALEKILASEQLALGGPITLRSHSDSAGSDKVNLEFSQRRGLAVARWLIDQGVADDRVTVIAFGEQNPVQPNAKADGSPNKEGRAANRRVEVTVDLLPISAIPTDQAEQGEGESKESAQARD